MATVTQLLLEQDGAVAHLRLNRPADHNAQLPSLWHQLKSAGQQLRARGDVSALIVSGEGRSFSSGLDRKAVAAGEITPASLTGRPDDRHRTRFEAEDVAVAQQGFRWLTDAPFVTIAAVQGYALGAGAQLALACDLRVFAEGAQLALLEAQLGLMPDLGGTATLTRLVGPARALELILTCDKVDAERALQLGIANSVVPESDLLAAAKNLAATIATRSYNAVVYSKRSVNAAASGDMDASYRLAAEGAASIGATRPEWKS
jgi:enoyl-CoA hydratase/carnithine racemase